MAWAGLDVNAAGIAAYYGDLLDGLVTDEAGDGLAVPVLTTETLMDDAATRVRVARETLDFAQALL